MHTQKVKVCGCTHNLRDSVFCAAVTSDSAGVGVSPAWVEGPEAVVSVSWTVLVAMVMAAPSLWACRHALYSCMHCTVDVCTEDVCQAYIATYNSRFCSCMGST